MALHFGRVAGAVMAAGVISLAPYGSEARSFETLARTQTRESLAERWARVETRLLPPARVEGRERTPLTLGELMTQARVPGVSIALIVDGQVAYTRAVGVADASSGRSLTPDTVFQAASISKPVAATLALALVEDGRLSLDEPINMVLDGWRVPENDLTATRPVTLRQILGHTSGITVSGFPGYPAAGDLPTMTQILNGEAPANTQALSVDQAPGEAWRYSGGGFMVAQLAMSSVSGKDFATLAHERVLGPLGMSRSTYAQPLPTTWEPDASYAHNPAGRVIAGRFHVYPEQAAAGLWTTPSDLARWGAEIIAAYRGETGRIISPPMARQMLTPGLGEWGLGVQVRGEGDALEFRHSGSNEGFRTLLVAFPNRGEGLVIMTNGEGGGGVLRALVDSAAAEFGWPGYEQKVVPLVAVGSAVLTSLTGTYRRGGNEAQIAVSDGGDTLVMTFSNGRSFELIPQGGDVFLDALGQGEGSFERNAAGQGAAVILNGARFERTLVE